MFKPANLLTDGTKKFRVSCFGLAIMCCGLNGPLNRLVWLSQPLHLLRLTGRHCLL